MLWLIIMTTYNILWTFIMHYNSITRLHGYVHIYFKMYPVTKNSLNGYVATAGGVQETELCALSKLCTAKHEK